ncbi:MAG: PSD1 and planctomycete cytochrome C domain-containing protein [Fuerstiella sp.]|nr:PSD1 and planctomycete cytochrome C domain-containing protein [Fuerstiella sp.]
MPLPPFSPPLRSTVRLAGLALCACLATSACADDAVPDGAALEFFEKNVRPILVEHCYECHAAGEVNGGLRLDSQAGVMKGGDTGPSLVAGYPEKSLLIEAVRYKNRDLQMPPQNALSPAQVAVLEKWVAMGAPDPRTDAVPDSGTGPTGMSIEDGQKFWSFRPVANPRIPDVSDQSWVRNPIDAFVLAQLESRGLRPAPVADKRSLIRRMTYNLIGLPPTPEEVDAFLADESEGAYDKVIERLLQSPHYGVRWGRHWLDVARYADSNGLDENLAFGLAWRYRDYVVDAFNNDKPFDRFMVEQLAGDLLPEANQETKTATSFLVLGAKVLAEPDMEKLVMDTIDEQLDTTGKAFLGMTFGCVRCHDHKFDPLKQTDYYALAAIFKSTRTFAETKTGVIKHWHQHSFATEEDKAKLKEIDAEIAKKKSAASSYKSKAIVKLRDAARAKATEYLVAAAKFEPSAPLSMVEAIAAPLELHPRILHHTRLHLEYNQDDPFFSEWHRLAAAGDGDGIDKHFRTVFSEAEAAYAAAQKMDPPQKTLTDVRLQTARTALHDLSGFLAVPPKVEFAFDGKTLAEYYRLEDEARILESNAPDEPAAMGVGEQTILSSLPIHIRGSHLNLGKPVAREFPEVMRTSNVRPVLPMGQSGRLELAQWMSSTQHPLSARVFVNRVWGWHFGRGIVGTTENFGRLGDRPSHPELLDWLARRFMSSGWSVKDQHRLILSSNAYQMASVHPAEQGAAENPAEVDPENLLLWKFRLQRLEAEQIRDSVLAVSDRLDMAIGGKTVPLRNRQFVFNHTSVDHTKYDSLRRALYLPVIRNNVYSLFSQFDFPDPTMPTGHRSSTVVAPQALLMMNSGLVMDSASSMASTLLDRGKDDTERVRMAYERTVGRSPSSEETQRAIAFVGELTSQSIGATGVEAAGQQQAWSAFCQSLFASNEFIYVR